MTGFSESDVTRDAFLGGQLRFWQPRQGYRAGIDPVLLAASVPARSGQTVLELGCGVGTAALCLARRVDGLTITGVEIQQNYAELAIQNAQENNLSLSVECADIRSLPEVVREERFDFVIANPPYFRPGAHSPSPDAGRSIAMGEDQTPLSDWIAIAARRLAMKGYLHMIQRVDRIPDLLSGCSGRLGSIELLPLSARAGRAPELVLLRARKGGRAPFHLHSPVILHKGETHSRDAESFTDEIADVLRDGKALERFNNAQLARGSAR